MPLTPTPEQLAAALDDAGDVSVSRIGHIQGRQVVIRLNWQGQPVEFQATITDVFAGEVPEQPKRRSERLHLHQRAEDLYGKGLTEAEVRHLGYPLYLAEEWLRRQKDRLGTFAEISRVYGYPETTLLGAARRHGWQPEKPPRHEAKAAVQAEWQAGHRNKKALAEKYSVSIGSVFNWIEELEAKLEEELEAQNQPPASLPPGMRSYAPHADEDNPF